ncbi:MAG: thioredoxin [Candidatus Bathyarchaeota archaeon B26-2]|nr:MAG: thioredoxin [Candidatus Bathyarchaeota archaeon B26-2]
MIAPVIEEMARDYAGKIVFGKLNMDENPRTAMKYQIMSIPTLLVFKEGRLVDRIVGAMPRNMLEPKITRHL